MSSQEKKIKLVVRQIEQAKKHLAHIRESAGSVSSVEVSLSKAETFIKETEKEIIIIRKRSSSNRLSFIGALSSAATLLATLLTIAKDFCSLVFGRN